MFTNADQLTSGKKVELMKFIETQKPLIVAISEMKPKNTDDREMLDYDIPDYSLHPVNLDSSAGRGIAVYTHTAIDKSSVQIKHDSKFEEACLLEIKLRGGDTMVFGCCYRSPTQSETSDENNENLNNLIRYITNKRYSHTCILGDFNFRDINWATGSTPTMKIVRNQNSLKQSGTLSSTNMSLNLRVAAGTTSPPYWTSS
jgi:exonuclease III